VALRSVPASRSAGRTATRYSTETVTRIVAMLVLAPLPLLAPFDEADPWMLVLNMLAIIAAIRMTWAAAVDHGFGTGFVETAAKILPATLLALVDVLVLAAAIFGALAVLAAGLAGRGPIAFVRELVRWDVAARHDRVTAAGPVNVLLH
jgi:hypothetical protein